MTKLQKKLAAYFLELASEEFSNHGCNDIDSDAIDIVLQMTNSERTKFCKEYHKYNRDDEETDIEDAQTEMLNMSDWEYMSFLAYKLEQEK